MPALEQLQTRQSLLFRLTRPGPCDDAAWREFVDQYAPLIYRWCRGHGLQDSDAKDATQQVLLKLAVLLPTFTYDPSKSFRGWLRTLTYHAWVDFLSAQGQRGTGDTGVWLALSSVASRDDLLQRIDAAFDLELLDQATARVRARVAADTWEAFRLTAVDGLPAAEAARRLGKRVATVYVARSNVQKMLRDEIAGLEAGGDDDFAGSA